MYGTYFSSKNSNHISNYKVLPIGQNFCSNSTNFQYRFKIAITQIKRLELFAPIFHILYNKNTFIVSAPSCKVQKHQQVKYLQTEVFNISDRNLGWTFFHKKIFVAECFPWKCIASRLF